RNDEVEIVDRAGGPECLGYTSDFEGCLHVQSPIGWEKPGGACGGVNVAGCPTVSHSRTRRGASRSRPPIRCGGTAPGDEGGRGHPDVGRGRSARRVELLPAELLREIVRFVAAHAEALPELLRDRTRGHTLLEERFGERTRCGIILLRRHLR